MNEYIVGRRHTGAYLESLGVDPECVASGSMTQEGYYEFVVRDGARVALPGESPLVEWHPWPEGFEWGEFVQAVRRDMEDFRTAGRNIPVIP